jgi:hypothetical protein
MKGWLKIFLLCFVWGFALRYGEFNQKEITALIIMLISLGYWVDITFKEK